MSDKKSQKLIAGIIGERSLERLEKAIFHNRAKSVSDPSELYLPLLVVPKAILAWLIENIKPMKVGEIKVLDFPGNSNIKIHFEKQDLDQYKAQFEEAGKIIHSFDKQGLPSIGGHLMSIGEIYDDFKSPVAEKIIEMADVKPTASDDLKWQTAQSNVKELTSVINKLVDALVSKEVKRKAKEEDLDKAALKEAADNHTPEVKEVKVKESKPVTYKDLFMNSNKDPIKVKAGPDLSTNKIEKKTLPETNSRDYFKKKVELLIKPNGLNKRESSQGSAQPFQPIQAKQPALPVPPGGNPAAQAAKQAQAAGRGKYVPPKQNNKAPKTGATQTKTKVQAAKPQAAKMAGKPVVKKDEYFKSKLNKAQKLQVTEDELYKSCCQHCQVPEFKKTEAGPVFNPCDCFSYLRKDEAGNKYKFVTISKSSKGFDLTFAKNSDPEVTKAFLLLLKANALIAKKFNK